MALAWSRMQTSRNVMLVTTPPRLGSDLTRMPLESAELESCPTGRESASMVRS